MQWQVVRFVTEAGASFQISDTCTIKSSFFRAFADSYVESDYARVYKTTSKRRAMLDKCGSRSDSPSAILSTEKGSSNSRETTPELSKTRKESNTRMEEDVKPIWEEKSGQRSKKPPLSKSNQNNVVNEDSGRSRSMRNPIKGSVRRKSQRNFMGVQATPSGRYKAKIYVPRTKKHIYIGIYDTPEEAAHAYDEVAYRKRGATAPLNFPELVASSKAKVKPPPKKVLIQLTDAGDFEALCYDPKLKEYQSVGVFSSVDAAKRTGAREAAAMESNSEASAKDDGECSSARHETISESKPMKGKRSKPAHAGGRNPSVSPEGDRAGSDDEDAIRKVLSQKSPFRSMRSKKGTFVRTSMVKKPSRRSNMTRRADFRGVYCNGQKFQSIYYNPGTKKHTYLGTFLTAEEAARAHDQVMV